MGLTGPVAELHDARIAITGGSGFLATNLIARLIDHCSIITLDNGHRDALSYAPFAQHPHLTRVRGDVLDPDAVMTVVRDADIVLHMAAIAGVGTVVSEPTRTLKTNMFGTAIVLDAIREQHHPPMRFIDFSTSEVYGPHVYRASEKGMTTQGSVYEPRWNYAVSKLASEYLTSAYHREYGLPTVCIRPFNVYGGYQVGEGCIRNFIVQALKGLPLQVHGMGDQIRSWCHVDDFTDGLLMAMTREEAIGKHFNLGNPRATTSTFELARMVIRLTESPSTVDLHPIDYPDVEVRVPSIDRAMADLHFFPRVDLEEGLQRTIRWYEAQPCALL